MERAEYYKVSLRKECFQGGKEWSIRDIGDIKAIKGRREKILNQKMDILVDDIHILRKC